MKDDEKKLPAYDLKDLVILIAEKHPTMRTILREVLHKFGVRKLYEASTPESGFEKFCDANPDIAFVDWGPEFDGMELLEKIRKDKRSPNRMVPVIIVTGYTEAHRVYEARDAGMTEFLAQPVSAEAIYKHMVKMIENARKFIKTDDYFGPDRRRHKGEYKGIERRKEVQASDGKPNGQKPKADSEGNESSS